MRFDIGDVCLETCWFTGGSQEKTVKAIDREKGRITFDTIAFELDGVHHHVDTYDLRVDDNGNEYAFVYEYRGHENRIYAKEGE